MIGVGESMVRIETISQGKIVLSQVSIFKADPEVQFIAGCRTMSCLTDGLEKYSVPQCHANMAHLLAKRKLDAGVISPPPRFYVDVLGKALHHSLRVPCENSAGRQRPGAYCALVRR